MTKNKIKWNLDGFEKLRKDPAIREELKRKADEILEDASENGAVEGYEVTELVLEDPRGAVSVAAKAQPAMNHNRKYHTLIRAAGRAVE